MVLEDLVHIETYDKHSNSNRPNNQTKLKVKHVENPQWHTQHAWSMMSSEIWVIAQNRIKSYIHLDSFTHTYRCKCEAYYHSLPPSWGGCTLVLMTADILRPTQCY